MKTCFLYVENCLGWYLSDHDGLSAVPNFVPWKPSKLEASIFKQTNRDLYLHGLEIRLPKPFETWNNMKRLIDRIVIRQFPDLNEDLILVTNRTHFSDSLKAHLNDLHVKAVFDNMPGKISQYYGKFRMLITVVEIMVSFTEYISLE